MRSSAHTAPFVNFYSLLHYTFFFEKSELLLIHNFSITNGKVWSSYFSSFYYCAVNISIAHSICTFFYVFLKGRNSNIKKKRWKINVRNGKNRVNEYKIINENGEKNVTLCRRIRCFSVILSLCTLHSLETPNICNFFINIVKQTKILGISTQNSMQCVH